MGRSIRPTFAVIRRAISTCGSRQGAVTRNQHELTRKNNIVLDRVILTKCLSNLSF